MFWQHPLLCQVMKYCFEVFVGDCLWVVATWFKLLGIRELTSIADGFHWWLTSFFPFLQAAKHVGMAWASLVHLRILSLVHLKILSLMHLRIFQLLPLLAPLILLPLLLSALFPYYVYIYFYFHIYFYFSFYFHFYFWHQGRQDTNPKGVVALRTSSATRSRP